MDIFGESGGYVGLFAVFPPGSCEFVPHNVFVIRYVCTRLPRCFHSKVVRDFIHTYISQHNLFSFSHVSDVFPAYLVGIG